MKQLLSILFLSGLLLQLANAQTPALSWFRQLDGYADLDKFNSLATDANGNVYAIGWTKKTSTEFNWIIIKYNTLGQRKWIREYDPGTTDSAVAVTIKGAYVYVVGRTKSGTNYAISTLKIDTTNGNDASGWPEVYNPSSNCDARQVKVGSAGDVFVAGTVYHTSSTGYADFVVIKYPSSGGGTSTTYVKDVGTNTPDTLRDMTIDNNDNVYITGASKSGSNINFVTIKLTSGLVESWSSPATYDNTSVTNGYDNPKRILVHPSGSIYVTGNSDGGATTKADIILVKYNSSGSQQWVTRYADGVPYNNIDDVQDMTTDTSSTNLYLCGNLGGAPQIIIKYDTSGTLKWGTRNGGSTYSMTARKIKVDNAGNVWVGTDGTSLDNQWSYGNDIILTEFDGSGSYVWGLSFDPTYNASANSSGPADYVNAMATDGSGGNIYLAGTMTPTVFSSSTSQDFFLTKWTTGSPFSQRAAFVSTGPMEEKGTHPENPTLMQNYPNPFNPTTTIRFSLNTPTIVSLKVYDVVGREVKILVNNTWYGSGMHEVNFDASGLSSGVYYYRIASENGKFNEVKKMTLIK